MRRGQLDDGGRLQMLAVPGQPNIDLAGVTGPAPEVGSSYPVEWVDIDEPDPNVDGFTNDEAIVAVGAQGRAKGAAIFSRLEGAAIHGNVVYFTSTQGGQTPPGDVDPVVAFAVPRDRHPAEPPWASAAGAARSGPTTSPASGCTCCTSRRRERCSTSPTTSRPVAPGHWSSARTATRATSCAGSPSRGTSSTSRSTTSPTASTTSSPAPRSARTTRRCTATGCPSTCWCWSTR